MLCSQCQTENREGRRFSSRSARRRSQVVCASCGFTNDTGDEFCGGYAQSLRVGTAIPPKFQAPGIYSCTSRMRRQQSGTRRLAAESAGGMQVRDPRLT
jgi:hypothetical protein